MYNAASPMTAVIISNGNICDYEYMRRYIEKSHYIICTDGAVRHLELLGIKPDVLLGDFDSISSSELMRYKSSGVPLCKYPAEKDMTDTELAVDFAVDKGYGRIIILGALGTRFDHSLSNIFLLKKMLDRKVEGVIIDEYNEIRLIKDRITLTREERVMITLLPLSSKVEGITTKGLRYPLFNATIEIGSSWGVSNEFTQDTAEVTIGSGLLLVIKSRD
ncbi:MAG: thiamine diphosphokinase [Acetivibrionales bacterium]|jgi:thiamine pyrophosphokinase